MNIIQQSSSISTGKTRKTFQTLAGRIRERITRIRLCRHLRVSDDVNHSLSEHSIFFYKMNALLFFFR